MGSTDLYIGLMSWDTVYRIRGFDVSRDPRHLQSICTEAELRELGVCRDQVIQVHGVIAGEGRVSVSCTSLSGEEIARFDSRHGNNEEFPRPVVTGDPLVRFRLHAPRTP